MIKISGKLIWLMVALGAAAFWLLMFYSLNGYFPLDGQRLFLFFIATLGVVFFATLGLVLAKKIVLFMAIQILGAAFLLGLLSLGVFVWSNAYFDVSEPIKIECQIAKKIKISNAKARSYQLYFSECRPGFQFSSLSVDWGCFSIAKEGGVMSFALKTGHFGWPWIQSTECGK